MTSLGSPGLSSQSVSGFSGQKGPKIPETDWDDKPRKPRLVIPVRFGLFWPTRVKKPQAWEAQACHPSPFRGFLAKKGNKKPKRTGMTSLGSPDLSSSPFRGFLVKKSQNAPKRTGMMTSLGRPGLSSQSVSGFSGQKGLHKNPETD